MSLFVYYSSDYRARRRLPYKLRISLAPREYTAKNVKSIADYLDSKLDTRCMRQFKHADVKEFKRAQAGTRFSAGSQFTIYFSRRVRKFRFIGFLHQLNYFLSREISGVGDTLTEDVEIGNSMPLLRITCDRDKDFEYCSAGSPERQRLVAAIKQGRIWSWCQEAQNNYDEYVRAIEAETDAEDSNTEDSDWDRSEADEPAVSSPILHSYQQRTKRGRAEIRGPQLPAEADVSKTVRLSTSADEAKSIENYAPAKLRH